MRRPGTCAPRTGASSPGLNIRHRNHKVTGVALHPPVLRTRTSHQPPRARHQAPRPDQATEDPAQDTPERVNAAPRRPGVPAQNGLPTPPEQHLPHPGIRTLQPDFSRDAAPQTPPEDPSPGHPASAGTNPPGNRVHQTAEESFHSRATCENPGTYGSCVRPRRRLFTDTGKHCRYR